MKNKMVKLIIGGKVDRERLMETGRVFLEDSLNQGVVDIINLVNRFTAEKDYHGHWQPRLRDVGKLEQAIGNYRVGKKRYESCGFILEGYDELVAKLTSVFNCLPIGKNDGKIRTK